MSPPITAERRFWRLRDQLSLKSVVLRRTDQREGGVLYIVYPANADSWARGLRTLDEVADFTKLVGVAT
jgi:hypothetical protein